MDIVAAIQECSKIFSNMFSYAKENKVRQSETQLIKDKRRLKQATNLAQAAFRITDRYVGYFSREDYCAYKSYRRRFDDKD